MNELVVYGCSVICERAGESILDSSDPVGKRGSKMIGRSRGESVHGVILQHDAKCVA